MECISRPGTSLHLIGITLNTAGFEGENSVCEPLAFQGGMNLTHTHLGDERGDYQNQPLSIISLFLYGGNYHPSGGGKTTPLAGDYSPSGFISTAALNADWTSSTILLWRSLA